VAKVPPFDIFSVDADGQLVWRETAATVDLARLRIEFLMVADSANYVVFDPLTGETFFTPVLAAATKRAKAGEQNGTIPQRSLGELTPTCVSLYGRPSGASPEAETLSDEQPPSN
jgi:hypothetical protein